MTMEIDIEKLRKAISFGPWTYAEPREVVLTEAAQYLADHHEMMLVDLPEGWYISNLTNGGTMTDSPWWKCDVRGVGNNRRPSGMGPTPRAASLAAREKIQ